MTEKHAQKLSIILKSGHVVNIVTEVPDPAIVDPQIEAFIKLLGSPKVKDKNFMFQGDRIFVIRLSEVAAADVMRVTLEKVAEEPANKKPAKASKTVH
ncbi:MAG: hypothetical protein Q4E62_03955 [Sutterellaceae bacterium]|nr:hypothetical protein [Sutterellaceae bacterium]